MLVNTCDLGIVESSPRPVFRLLSLLCESPPIWIFFSTAIFICALEALLKIGNILDLLHYPY